MEKASAKRLGEIFGVHRQTVIKWVQQGCPYLERGERGRGKEWLFDTAEVAKWREDVIRDSALGDVDDVLEDELRRRKLAAETTVAEIEAAKAKGEAAMVDDIVKIVTDDYVRIKQRLRSIPARLAPNLVGELNETVIRAEIENEINEALNELAARFIDGSSELDSEDQQAQSAT